VVDGTDEGIPGHSVHREIELYVEAGFTPMEALQAATLVPARVMKLDGELGTLERGKRADMVVLNANPLDQIRNIRTVRWTISGGRVYDAAALWKSVRFQAP
jgi:imidazolonepropionase-like amidohydrolase